MSQDAGPRIISKYIERVQLDYAVNPSDPGDRASSINYTNSNATGWVLVNPTSDAPILQWQGYIDVSGYRPDDMVLFPQSVQLQRGACMWTIGLEPAAGGNPPYSIPGGDCFMQYSLTTDKVDDIDYGTGTINEPLVGFLGDNSEMEQVIYSASEQWVCNAASGDSGLRLNQLQEAGDGVPIVGPRIYITIRATFAPKYIGYASASGAVGYKNTTWLVPPMRFVIAGLAKPVAEYELLHLMKRQIDLQQTPDVDL